MVFFYLELIVHSLSYNESGGGFSEIIWHTALLLLVYQTSEIFVLLLV